MKVAGYKDDVIYGMDDVAVFRRFFVASKLLAEIIQGLMGGMSNAIMGGGEQAPMTESQQTAAYGTNPYADVPKKESPQQNDNPSTVNDVYNFPSG